MNAPVLRATGLLAVLAGLAGLGAAAQPAEVQERAGPPRPNIVFVLADDLDWTLLPYMPEVQRLRRDGVTLERFFVSASLCCVSRASILTGRYPHNTQVLTNVPPAGGYAAWSYHGDATRSFAMALSAAGYRTGMFGKYLNGYEANSPPDPGWTDWLAGSRAYRGFEYDLSDNGFLVHHGSAPTDYATDVIARAGAGFIREAVAAGGPFMAKLGTFAPHPPAVPAPRHADLFRDLELPVDGAFDRITHHPPRWLGDRRALTFRDRTGLRMRFRKRVRSVQAIDELLGMVRATLDELGVASSTYIVFSSDNGFHLGQHRLTHGKRTAYDADIRVPTVIAGPGLPAGTSSAALASNVDLSPTFLDWAGLDRAEQDGRSLDRVLHGDRPRHWRRGILVEHHFDGRPPTRRDYGPRLALDPDAQSWRMGLPGTYAALRTADHLYVRHKDGSRELYDLRSDPYELHNLAGDMTRAERRRWRGRLQRFKRCAAASCRRADRLL
jgi:arylsulfatase A-like enzyme